MLTLMFIAACQPEATATPFAAVEASPGPKQLATVYMSPTPNQAEQEATRSANRPTLTVAPPTPVPTVTPYIGVFLGEAETAGDETMPIVDPTLFADEQVFELPTERPIACPSQADPVFGTNWSADPAVMQALRCPTQPAITFRGTAQVFERGVMYWREDTGEIWAIAMGETGRFWFAANPPPAEETPITAPEGLRVPTLGFGNVWRGVAGVRDGLGFARTDEQPTEFSYQAFEGGALLSDGSSGQVFALVGANTAFGPF
jgi:hypothetical protein